MVSEDITYGAIANISYKSELTLDIFDVKGSIRTSKEVFQRRLILDIENVKYQVLIEGGE